MAEEAIKIGGKKKSIFLDKVKELLPEGGNLNLCLTCGACSSGCPATGIGGMDPRKFLRMAALGMDEEILKSEWVWWCSMCQRCIYVCPMKIDIPQLTRFQCPGLLAQGRASQGDLGILRYGASQRHLQRHGCHGRRLPVRGGGCVGRVPGKPA